MTTVEQEELKEIEKSIKSLELVRELLLNKVEEEKFNKKKNNLDEILERITKSEVKTFSNLLKVIDIKFTYNVTLDGSNLSKGHITAKVFWEDYWYGFNTVSLELFCGRSSFYDRDKAFNILKNRPKVKKAIEDTQKKVDNFIARTNKKYGLEKNSPDCIDFWDAYSNLIRNG